MSLVQLYIPSEVSHDTISELAEMGNFQFKDVSYPVCAGLSSSRAAQPGRQRVPATIHPTAAKPR